MVVCRKHYFTYVNTSIGDGNDVGHAASWNASTTLQAL